MIKVFIIDGKKLFGDRLIQEIKKCKDIIISGEMQKGSDPLHDIKILCPDLVIIDIKDRIRNRIDLISRIIKQCPQLKIMILTDCTDRVIIAKSMGLNIKAYILKEEDYINILNLIRRIYKGEKYYSKTVKKIYEDIIHSSLRDNLEKDLEFLDPVEYDLFNLLMEGRKTSEISNLLEISERTVYYRKKNILFKLGEKKEKIFQLFQRSVKT